MALASMASGSTFVLPVVLASLVAVSSLLVYLLHKTALPANAPAQTRATWPILGSVQFFTQRWDFYKRAMSQSKTGNFSFYAGQWPVIALSGLEERKLFFEDKRLGSAEAYAALLAGSPDVKPDNNPLAPNRGNDSDFPSFFQKRLTAMLKSNVLRKLMPQLLQDARYNMDRLAANPAGITDPFDSIYRTVFNFTMRTLACNDFADDPAALRKVLKLFETIQGTATPLAIMYPWLPTPSKFRKMLAGSQLYMMFKRVVDERRKTGRKDDDALQFLLDQGDSLTDVLTVVLGALFAGQLNSGINAAWILCYLAKDEYWLDRVRREVVSVADKYCSDTSMPLKERLMNVPLEAWESEFPIIDLCLKDSIRLQMSGTAFRNNISDRDIPIGKHGEVIPAGGFVTFAPGEMHYNPAIYTNPDEWDPGRYLPERAEDKKETYAWMGWGESLFLIIERPNLTYLSRTRSASVSGHAICEAREQSHCCLLHGVFRRV